MCRNSAPSAVVAGGGGASRCAARGRETAGQQPDRGALDIAFDPGDLAGEAQPRHRLQAQPAVKKARAVEESVAMQAAEPREFARSSPGSCGRCASARRAAAWSGTRRCCRACRARCPGELAGEDRVERAAERRAEREAPPPSAASRPGPHRDEDAGEADEDRRPAARPDRLAEERDRQHADPERRR